MLDEYNGRSQAFVDWFRSLRDATLHENLKLEDLRSRNAGRGIIATADIPADTVLFTIPRHSVICTSTSALHEKLPSHFEDVHGSVNSDDDIEETPTSWLNLILVMIYEHFQGSSSRWKEYLDVLPANFDTLMFWTPSELSELQASAVREKIGKVSADAMFRQKILPVVKSNASVFCPGGSASLPTDEALLELAHRMGSTIMSYAFDLETTQHDEDSAEDGWIVDTDDQTAMAMVPMADMLNADAEFNAHLNHGEAELTMVSLRHIAAGEEVLNYYGPLPTSDLVRRYGYATLKHARYDVVEIRWDTVVEALKQTISTDKLASVLARLDPDDIEDSYVFERRTDDGPDETGRLEPEVGLVEIPEDLGELLKHTITKSLDPESGKMRIKSVYVETLLTAVSLRQAEYITSIAEDERMLQASGMPLRKEMAVRIRLGEKRLLAELTSQLQSEMEKLRDKQPPSAQPPSKKQKTR